jgi:hypothetical protein
MKASNNERIMAFVDDMSFPTDYVPLTSHIGHEVLEQIPVEQAKALYRTDTNPWTRLDIHTAGKSKRKYSGQTTLDGVAKDEITYQLVPNSTFLGTVVKSLDDAQIDTSNVKITNNLYDKTGASFWTSFAFPEYRVDIKTSNGTVRTQNARVDMRSSYDRTQRLMYDCGFYDFLCLNGQVSGKIFMSYVHKHTTGLDIIKLQDTIYKSIKALPSIAEEYNMWANKEISDFVAKRIIRKTMAEKMSKTVDAINNKVEELFEIYQNEVNVTGANLFSLYQMGTWISTHGLTQDRTKRLTASLKDKYRNHVVFMIQHPEWQEAIHNS